MLLPLLVAAALQAAPPEAIRAGSPRRSPAFERNAGQWPSATRFLLRGRTGSLHLQDDGLAFVRREGERVCTVRLAFVGASACEPAGAGDDSATFTYHGVRSGAAAMVERVRYDDLWPGVDLVVRLTDAGLEYDLELAPGADLAAVALELQGAAAPTVHPDGRLEAETAAGPFFQRAPRSFELDAEGRRVERDSRCVVDGTRLRFAVDGRDPARALVVDPILDWATHLGGLDYDSANAAAIDADGRTYVVGSTSSPDFPATPGSFDSTPPVDQDAFVVCLDPGQSGASQLVWGSFLSGSSFDELLDVTLAPDGALALVGVTDSADFPATSGAFATAPAGGGDAFVARLSADGASLDYLSFYGGSGYEWASGVGVDALGRIVVGGYTTSADLPLAGASWDGTLGGFQDAFVATVDPAGGGAADLVDASYFGGSGDESVWDAHLDCAGRLWLAGETTSADLPTSAGAFQVSPGGGLGDGFVASLASSADLAYATYLGGSGTDVAWSVDARGDGGVALAGKTQSSDFPTTPGAFDATLASFTTAWIARLEPAGQGPSDLAYSTLYHGASWTEFYRVAALPGGLLAGGGFNDGGLPVTPDAAQPQYGGGFDDHVAIFAPDGGGASDLLYATYVGGSGAEGAFGLALRAPWLVLCGRTKSSANDFPVTPGAFDATYGGGSQDGIAVRFDLAAPGPRSVCTAKPNSLGLSASLSWIGRPSASGADDFVLVGRDLVPGRFAVAMLSVNPGSGTWFGAPRCVGDPFVRSPVQRTTCAGEFAERLTQAELAQLGFGAGATMYAQVVYRDPGLASPSVATTDALFLTIEP